MEIHNIWRLKDMVEYEVKLLNKISTYTQLYSKEERNPAHYCHCGKYIGKRGFCSKKCHDKYYEGHNV